jgi:hypothetical protein
MAPEISASVKSLKQSGTAVKSEKKKKDIEKIEKS